MHKQLQQYLESKYATDRETTEKILSFFKVVNTKRNQILLQNNQVCKQYYFINNGCIRIFTENKDGTENTRYFAFENNFATALPSFIDQHPADEYVQTIEKSELLSISRNDFYHLVQTNTQFAKLYTDILEHGFIVAQKRIYGFQGYDALDKVKWLIKQQPQVLLRISNKLVASYLGISPSTLSRIKTRL